MTRGMRLVVLCLCFVLGFVLGKEVYCPRFTPRKPAAMIVPVSITETETETETGGTYGIPNWKRPVDLIVLHHSGIVIQERSKSPDRYKKIVEAIRQHHKQLGWDDIGYHYIIDPDGVIHIGRSLNTCGAHTKGFNANSIGICLLGNFEVEEPTEKQLAQLNNLLRKLQDSWIPNVLSVRGHSEISLSPTLCPGKNLLRWLHARKEDPCQSQKRIPKTD